MKTARVLYRLRNNRVVQYFSACDHYFCVIMMPDGTCSSRLTVSILKLEVTKASFIAFTSFPSLLFRDHVPQNLAVPKMNRKLTRIYFNSNNCSTKLIDIQYHQNRNSICALFQHYSAPLKLLSLRLGKRILRDGRFVLHLVRALGDAGTRLAAATAADQRGRAGDDRHLLGWQTE